MNTKRKMQLQCPMPKLDFDVITLGHGSGGVLTNRLLDQVVLHLLQNDVLDTRHDGAVLEMQGKQAFTTDSFVVSPVFFPGGNIGDLAVNGTVNDLAMCGAIPQYLSLSFILEEGLPMERFWDILVSVKAACETAGVQVVTGDTKVVEKGKGDQVFINTSGIGRMHPQAQIHASRIQPGDKIIVSGPVATHGTAIMALREGLEFDTTIESDSQSLQHLTLALLDKYGADVHLFRDPTRGGLGTVLTEIARDTKLGMEVEQADLPLQQQVSALCEILGLDPLYVANEGIFAAIVAGDAAEAMVATLRELPGGEAAAIIGQVVEDHPGKAILRSGIGGRRVINMLVGEQLPRIC